MKPHHAPRTTKMHDKIKYTDAYSTRFSTLAEY